MNIFKQWVLKPQQKIITKQNVSFDKDCDTTHSDNVTLNKKCRSSEPNLKNCCDPNKFFRCYTNQAYKNDAENKDDTLKNNYLDCNCHNCMTLPLITECKVCLGPFQGRDIKSCITCGNLVCKDCVGKIKFCAFCRSECPFQHNRAIERLFNELILPCKNMRNGCNTVLYNDERLGHELKCPYSSLQCPMTAMKKCSWFGLTSDILEHLKTVHQVTPLNGAGVTIELNDFWRKMVFAEGKYSVYLNCYQQLFLLRVSFYGGKIRMSVSQVNYLASVNEKFVYNHYTICIKVISCNKKSHYQKIYPFKAINKRTDNIVIDCAVLLAKDIYDSAKIDIVLNKNIISK